MKAKKTTSSRSRTILSLLCVGGLMLIGFTQALGQYSLAQLQTKPVNLPVPALKQSRGTSCGEAVIVMTYNYAYPATPITEQQVIEYATANGYFTEDLPPFTSPGDMVKIAEYYADNVTAGRVLSAGQGLSLLIQRLRGSEPVIIDVLSNFSDPQSEAHFVVVTGISLDSARNNAVIIQYNDPLTGTTESADWEGSQGVWNAWWTNVDPGGAGWWLVIPPA
jgi:Papain-like cysteine protease AvrRpt2